jgi:hypothetical protein
MNKLIVSALTLGVAFLSTAALADTPQASDASKSAKMHACMAKEKAKNNSKSEAERQQTCMVHIMNAQGDPNTSGKKTPTPEKTTDTQPQQ